jgi:hypothetical protein
MVSRMRWCLNLGRFIEVLHKLSQVVLRLLDVLLTAFGLVPHEVSQHCADVVGGVLLTRHHCTHDGHELLLLALVYTIQQGLILLLSSHASYAYRNKPGTDRPAKSIYRLPSTLGVLHETCLSQLLFLACTHVCLLCFVYFPKRCFQSYQSFLYLRFVS